MLGISDATKCSCGLSERTESPTLNCCCSVLQLPVLPLAPDPITAGQPAAVVTEAPATVAPLPAFCCCWLMAAAASAGDLHPAGRPLGRPGGFMRGTVAAAAAAAALVVSPESASSTLTSAACGK